MKVTTANANTCINSVCYFNIVRAGTHTCDLHMSEAIACDMRVAGEARRVHALATLLVSGTVIMYLCVVSLVAMLLMF